MAWMFRLLGPLTVERDSVEVAVKPGKLRALLASLLLDTNHLVPLDELVNLLWEGEPPRSAVANIRTYASQLRVLVADKDVERVVWRPPGYVFAAEEGELDLLAYRRLVDHGRKALASGDMPAAASRFSAALGLWRGAAAEDVTRTMRLGSRLNALDEQRLVVTEDWMEARLALGDHREALGELRRLTSAYPLRERLWCQLMLASYRVGSTGPALQVFDEARQVLGDELGVEPGPELSNLFTAILRHDPALLPDPLPVAPVRVSRKPRPVPCELPLSVVTLVGRERELAAIRAAALTSPVTPLHGTSHSIDAPRRNRPVIVAIHGPGGVGKSTLAILAAHDLRQNYPDGQIYVDLHGSTVGLRAEDPSDVLRRLLRTLDADPEQIRAGREEATACFRSLTADRKMIILLDNAVDEAQIRPLLPGSTDTLVLITSRRMLAALDGPVHLQLQPISADAAWAMLSESAGAQRVAAEPEELSRLAQLCDYLPLALRVVVARLASQPDRPLSAISVQLSNGRGRLDALCYGDLAVRSSLAISYQRLPASCARLFRLFGVVRLRDVGTPIASAIVDCSLASTEQVLDQLVDAQLLEQPHHGRYRMHDLVRLYAGEVGADDGDIQPALHRVVSCYVSTARRAVALLRPGLLRHGTDQFVETGERVCLDGPAAALAWLEAERDNMIEVARQVHDAEPDLARSVPLLTAALYQYLAPHEYWEELGELGELARTIAVRLGDQRAEATALTCLAVVGRHRGRIGETMGHLDRAIGIRCELGDQGAVASLLSHRGLAYAHAGDWAGALEHLRRSIELHQTSGNRTGEGIARNDVAEVLCHLGRYAGAAEMFAEALEIRRAVGDVLGEAITMTGIGKLACLRGSYDVAVTRLSDALARCSDFGARHYEWQALVWRAYAWSRLDRMDRAAADLVDAVAMSRARGNQRQEGLTTRLLGLVWRRRGRTTAAAEQECRAVELLGDEHPQAIEDSVLLALWH